MSWTCPKCGPLNSLPLHGDYVDEWRCPSETCDEVVTYTPMEEKKKEKAPFKIIKAGGFSDKKEKKLVAQAKKTLGPVFEREEALRRKPFPCG